MRFMTFEGKMNARRFIEFLERLVYKSNSPIFLILDGHPVHRPKPAKEFVRATKGWLRVFILPPYSPHLNPDEWVWNWLKKHNLGRTIVIGPKQFKEMVRKFMLRLQKMPKSTKGFFQDSNLSYIGA